MPQLSSRARAHDSGSFESQRSCVVPAQAEQPGDVKTFTPVFAPHSKVKTKSLLSEQRIRHAALLTLFDAFPQPCLELETLSRSQWQHLLRWLDLSGLALYFFDRIGELQLGDSLPASVFARLRQNLHDNTERTHGMIAESIAIQEQFQEAGLRYAILKGLSLWPSSVSKPELRSQFDIDFLVAEDDLPEARKILARRGYRLYGMNGRSWEFKRNEKPGIRLKDMYKDTGSWVVELHAEPSGSYSAPILERLEWRGLSGFPMPTLSPVDLFLRQGLHAYKHICSEFARVAHLVEFRRHVLFRFHDELFWEELRWAGDQNPRVCVGLGVTTLLISQVMGEFAPEALTRWTVRCLPRSAKLWVEWYGHRAVLGSFPGSKLYVLLQTELEAVGVMAERPVRRLLIPSCLPPPVIRAFPNEAMSVRLGRYRMQVNLILSRLRFHVVEGLRLAWEFRRWRRHFNRNNR